MGFLQGPTFPRSYWFPLVPDRILLGAAINAFSIAVCFIEYYGICIDLSTHSVKRCARIAIGFCSTMSFRLCLIDYIRVER